MQYLLYTGLLKGIGGHCSAMAAICSIHKLVLVVALLLTGGAAVVVMLVSADQIPQPPSPSPPVTSYFKTMAFDEGFSNSWSPGHQNISHDRKSVTLRIDRYSGGGFKSKEVYKYGFFNAALKLQAGYTAGIVTTFYLTNSDVYPHRHDELDLEFLGTIPGEPYTVNTNIYGDGSGDGREQRFHLWFDPTKGFHNYSILWTPYHSMFFVDSIPIRQFRRLKSLKAVYPLKPMSIYGTMWDGSDWATDGGKYRANYSYEPFLSTYTDFIISGCRAEQRDCNPGYLDRLIPPTLSKAQKRALNFVRSNYMTYDYCQDVSRYPKGLPECPRLSTPYHDA